MPFTPTPTPVVRAVQEMHPDPFVQQAILRVYAEAPGLLTDDAVNALADAYATPETTTN